MPDDTVPRPGSVTLVVVAYNHAQYVEQCLDSAFAQTHQDLRVVIFDDASPDNTVEVVRDYLLRTGHEAVTFVAHEKNRGLCATLNEARELVDTEYVAFLAADDWMEPERFEEQVAELAGRGAGYGFVYSDMYRVTPSGERLGSTYFDDLMPRHSGLPGPPDGDIFETMVGQQVFSTPSMMIRTSELRAAGPYDEGLRFEDYDMILRLAHRTKAAYLPRPLVNYRDTPGSMFDQLYQDIPTLSREFRAIYRKHLTGDPQADRLLAGRIGAYAKASYLAGEPAASVSPDLALALRHSRTAPNRLYAGLSRVGVPGPILNRAVATVRSLKITLRETRRVGPVT